MSVVGGGGRGEDVESFRIHISESEGNASSVCIENKPRGLLPVEENSETTLGWMIDENISA